MKKRDDSVYLHDILDSIDRIQEYLLGISFDEFGDDLLRQDGVLRQIGIIGEAARSLSEQFRAAHPQVPWHMITGMRHIVVHEYFQVDLEVVWDTVQEDLPPLREQVREILDNG